MRSNKTPKNTTYSKDNTADLSAVLEGFRNGDHEAFERLFLQYYEKVKYFISVLVKSTAVAEDLSQEIFVNLWENHAKIDPRKNFNAYIYTIARNTVYNHIKSQNVRNRYADSKIWEIPLSADGEEIIIAKEMELLVAITVSQMPKQRQRIYDMIRTEGKDKDEVAALLGITKNAVDKQFRLALNDLRERLAVLLLFFG